MKNKATHPNGVGTFPRLVTVYLLSSNSGPLISFSLNPYHRHNSGQNRFMGIGLPSLALNFGFRHFSSTTVGRGTYNGADDPGGVDDIPGSGRIRLAIVE